MPEQLSLNEVHDLYFRRGTREMTATFTPQRKVPYKQELVVLGLRNEYTCSLVHNDAHVRVILRRVKGTEYETELGSTLLRFRAERVVQPIEESPLDLPVYKLVLVSGHGIGYLASTALLNELHAA